jgi:hypothetical protein
LQDIHQSIFDDAKFNRSSLIVITGIAYNGAVLYYQVANDNDSGTALRFKLFKWIKVLCADIGGAIGGSSLGPAGTIIVGIAGSVAAWPEPEKPTN